MATNMFRLLSPQTVKAAPRLFRYPTGTTCRIHSLQLPYTGPPSYETITQRFSSSQVDPPGFFARKRNEEARDRGEFVDIHDIHGPSPTDYDVLISDIKHETLDTRIAEEVGVSYLSKATEAEAKKVVHIGEGYIRGAGYRAIVSFVVGHQGNFRWVFFILDSGSPSTYVSSQAGKVLGITEEDPATVTIAGHRHIVHVSPLNSHFWDINILGGDFCKLNEVFLCYDYVKRRVKLHFGGKWRVVEDESKL